MAFFEMCGRGVYMEQGFQQVCFQIGRQDNVCVALAELSPGSVRVNGSACIRELEIKQPISQGHKLANCDIPAGGNIIKYNVVIGRATKDICQGEWVHLHNCESLYDERSSTLDVETGAPTDTKYI